jgi:copper resistance protein C
MGRKLALEIERIMHATAPLGSHISLVSHGVPGIYRHYPRVKSEVEMMSVRSLWISLLGLVLLVPTGVWSHAVLVKSIPAHRAVLSRVPTRVQLWFNERLEAQFCSLSVWNAGGQQVDRGDVHVSPEDPKKLSVGLAALAPGTYTVKYRVLSVDGHIVEQAFSFTLRNSP